MANSVIAIAAATLVQFIVGGVWYTFVFGKLWGDIHGYNKLSKEVQAQMAKDIMPFYGLQLVVTIFTAAVMGNLMVALPDHSPYALAFYAWLGFAMPMQFSGVIFGGTESQWIVKKFLILAGGSLACLMAGAAILSLF